MFAVGAPLQGIISFHLHFNVCSALGYAMHCMHKQMLKSVFVVVVASLNEHKNERMVLEVLSTIFVPRHNQEWLRSIFTYSGYMSYFYLFLAQQQSIFRNELNENAIEPKPSLSLLPKKTLIHDVVICFCHSHHIQLVHQLPLSYAVCNFHADNHRMKRLTYTFSKRKMYFRLR